MFEANSKWLKVPWDKISLRISMLTKQIFLEIKKHNLGYVYKLQSYLLNSIELKIFVVNKVLSKTYFLFYRCKKNFFKNIDNLKISIVLEKFNEKLQDEKSRSIIKQRIKEQVIVTCITPTLRAKLANFSCICNYLDVVKNSNNCFNCVKNSLFINKITNCIYLKKSINKFLNDISYLDMEKIYVLKQGINLISKVQNLNFINKLSNTAINNDIKWYHFVYLRANKNLEKTETFGYNKVDNLMTTLWLQIRQKWKNYKSLVLSEQHKQLLNKLLQIYCINLVNSFLSIDVLNKYHKSINQVVRFIKKKSNSVIKYKFKLKLNYSLNRSIYVNNLKKVHYYF